MSEAAPLIRLDVGRHIGQKAAVALVAQWIEQRFPKPKVVRSNRAGGATFDARLGG